MDYYDNSDDNNYFLTFTYVIYGPRYKKYGIRYIEDEEVVTDIHFVDEQHLNGDIK